VSSLYLSSRCITTITKEFKIKLNYLKKIKTYSEDIEERYKLGDKIGYITPLKTEIPPHFSFEYAIFDNSSIYTFKAKSISLEEYETFFYILKELSVTNLCDVFGNKKLEKYNFKINNDVNKELRRILKYVSKVKYFRAETEPSVGHFHLYKPEKRSDKKCPVIHFFIGTKPVIYILCYDEFHNIQKVKR